MDRSARRPVHLSELPRFRGHIDSGARRRELRWRERIRSGVPPEFRRHMVELVKSGRTAQELARAYEPSAGSIRNWVAQEERDAGQRSDGLSTDELLELRRLRRENKQLRTERDILERAAGLGSRGRATRSPGGIRVRKGESGRLAGAHHVSGAGSLAQRLPCMAAPQALGASAPRCAVDRADQGDPGRQLRRVRAPAHPHRAARGRQADRREAGRAADARGRHRRRQPQAFDEDHHARAARCPRGAGSGGSGLQRRRRSSRACGPQ